MGTETNDLVVELGRPPVPLHLVQICQLTGSVLILRPLPRDGMGAALAVTGKELSAGLRHRPVQGPVGPRSLRGRELRICPLENSGQIIAAYPRTPFARVTVDT